MGRRLLRGGGGRRGGRRGGCTFCRTERAGSGRRPTARTNSGAGAAGLLEGVRLGSAAATQPDLLGRLDLLGLLARGNCSMRHWPHLASPRLTSPHLASPRLTTSQVKVAYRSRARACHPDTSPGSDADPEAFRRLSRAYDEVLRHVERGQT